MTESTASAWRFPGLPSGRTWAIAIPFAFLLVFFMLPFLLVLKISFAQSAMEVPLN